MKKVLFFATVFFFSLFSAFSESYKIKNAEYDITGAGFKLLGKTREYPLKTKYPLDTKKIFEDREALELYLQDYKSKLESTRLFDEIELDYEAYPLYDDENAENEVILKIRLQDSHHFLVMPYPKYSSNSGLSLKLKAKDTNFLGSLNTMNTDLNINWDKDEFETSLSFSFDFPFKAGPFDAVFVNDYEVSYFIDEDDHGFEWDTKTGLDLSLPFKHFSIDIGLYQYTNRDIDYIEYDDQIYFTEELEVGLPVKIATLPNFTTISYKPSASLSWYWDYNGINEDNDGLYCPEITFSHSISNDKVQWNDFLRKGYDISAKNKYVYNFQSKELHPTIEVEGEFFWSYQANEGEIWNKFGICSDIYFVHCFQIPTNKEKFGKSIGGRLRGLLDDDTYFGNDDDDGTATTAIVINIDLPHNVFKAYLPPVEILNFNFQFSPFFDMALVYNDITDRYFSFEDGYYCGGIEFLVTPLRWSSITVRASLGIDLKSNFFIEGIKKNKEIFIGIGLQY